MSAELYWTKVAAIGQVAGAVATAAAVIVSLYIALRSPKPRLRVRANVSLIFGEGPFEGERLLTISVANLGENPVHVRSLGWKTGWLPFGPAWLRRQFAVQMTGSTPFGQNPPFEVGIGSEVSAYCVMENVNENARERRTAPFFTRDFPLVGRRRTRVLVAVHTATGHTVHARPEDNLVKELERAEQQAISQAA